jgi:transcription antitermination factor NusG
MPDLQNKLYKNWYALYTKPRHEFKAKLQLHQLEIENYLPTIKVVKKWSDRKKKIEEPLFRGYIFVFVNERERLLSLNQSTIIKTICFEGKPCIIPQWQIENLQKMLEKNPQVFISDKIEVGAKVKITEGPFSDIIGVVTEYKPGEKYLGVTIDMLYRTVLVRLPKESSYKIINC